MSLNNVRKFHGDFCKFLVIVSTFINQLELSSWVQYIAIHTFECLDEYQLNIVLKIFNIFFLDVLQKKKLYAIEDDIISFRGKHIYIWNIMVLNGSLDSIFLRIHTFLFCFIFTITTFVI